MKVLASIVLFALLISTTLCAVPTCANYCAAIQANCNGTNAQYSDSATCLSVCGALELGGDDTAAAATQATVGCRLYHATAALSTGDPVLHCPHAGPSGGGQCGTNLCQVYCNITMKTCVGGNKVWSSMAACMDACSYFNVSGNYAAKSGANVECRIYHVTVASGSQALADAHCAHASASGYDQCGSRCENYCQIVPKTCPAPNLVANNDAACLSYCGGNPDGIFNATGGNSKDCRIYHALAASSLNDRAVHCPHASHSGGTQCGSYCEVYCALAATACTGSRQLFTTPALCMSACAGYAATGKPGDTTGNTVQCRIYHLGAALSNATLHCPHGAVDGGGATFCGGAAPTTSTSTPTSSMTETRSGNAFGLFVSFITLMGFLLF